MNESEVPPPRRSQLGTLPPEAESRLPRDPRLPSDTDPDSVGVRLAALSDSLHDENGLVHQLFAEVERRAAERHKELIAAVKHVAEEQLRTTSALERLQPEHEQHAARLRMLEGSRTR